MTIDELADSWWQYRAEVRATQLAPIIERQRNALKEFYESLIEYEKFADKYEEDRQWASDLTRRIRGEGLLLPRQDNRWARYYISF